MESPGSSAGSDDFDLIERQEANLSPEALAQAQTWLQPTDYQAESSEFGRHLSSQAPGTGLWICDTPCFRQWYDLEEHGSLWIKGVPGAGKSVVAASMVEYLKTIDPAPVLYFFFRYIIAANRRPRSLIRDWLAQLLPHSIRLQASLQPVLSGELDDVSDDQLWEHLIVALSSIDKAFCVVDALDEMELMPGDGFLGRLNELASFRPRSVKLLMTSRPKQYLQSHLRDTSIVHISLEHDLVGKDIAAFVSYRLKDVVLPDQGQLRELLVSTICAKSRGLFLYSRLLLDQIAPKVHSLEPLDVAKLAKGLPMGLEEMYNSMLFQQSQSLGIGVLIQLFLLECVTHSSRPLRLNELASVLVTVFEPAEIPGTPKAVARSACAPLLEILEDETVQVIHHSFTEFLLDAERVTTRSHGSNIQFPVLAVDEIHKKIATACLSYLQSGGLRPNVKATEDESRKSRGSVSCLRCDNETTCNCKLVEDPPYVYQTARLHHPFLEYAVENWAYHASHYDVEDQEFFRTVSEFVDSENPHFRRWVFLKCNTKMRGRLPSLRDPTPSALHMAAYAGLTEYAKYLLQEGQSVHSVDSEERTPLHWASKHNCPEIVSLLLENGANPDPADIRGAKPIHEAARKNYASIVRMLLEAGVDPVSPKTRENHAGRSLGGETHTTGETAIHYVCIQGHSDALTAMMPFLRPEILEEALCESCRYGKAENVHTLLANPNVSPNSRFSGATALYLACQVPSVECVKLLISRGVDVNQKSTWSPRITRYPSSSLARKEQTPLHALVWIWWDCHDIACEAIFRMLVNAGADLEAKDHYSETALICGPRRLPRQITAEFFLAAGADVSATDRDGHTLLHQVVEFSRDVRFLKVLVNYGADLNARSKTGDTILHALFANGFNTGAREQPNTLNEVMEFLRENGTDFSTKDHRGHTILELAIRKEECSFETLQLLLKSCSDEKVLRSCLFTVCLQRDYEKEVRIIQELMSAGVSLESRDETGQTALLYSHQHEDTVKALLKCGANLYAENSNGWGLLDHLVAYGSSSCVTIERLQGLVETGLDPFRVDKKGNSILHHAITNYRDRPDGIQLVDRILDYGVSVNSKNFEGRTPLHVHIETTHFDDLMSGTSLSSLIGLFQRREGEKLDINTQDEDGLTLLHIAVMRSETLVSQLFAAGANANFLTKNGRSILHLACRARKSNIVGYILQQTGKMLIDKVDSFGRTALHDACTSGRPESVHYLLDADSNITTRDYFGRTPLHACAEFVAEQQIWASLENYDEAAGQFIHDRYRPAHPDRSICLENPWYKSPLEENRAPTFTEHDTLRIGGVVQLLIAAGADINATDSREHTPLDLALNYGCQEMTGILWTAAKELRTSGQSEFLDIRLQTLIALNQRAPISVLQLSKATIIEILQNPNRYFSLLKHCDICWLANHREATKEMEIPFDRNSLLYVAARNGLVEIIESLGGLAKENDDTEAARIRLEKLPEPKYCSEIDFIPLLHSACQRQLPNLEMLQLLVQKCGVDVDVRSLLGVRSRDGSHNLLVGGTALHVLAESHSWWQIDAIKLLINMGADINARDEKGATPLHIASLSGTHGNLMEYRKAQRGFWKPACAKILLELGADPNALDNAGMSPLNNASATPDIMRMLVQHGANFHAGKTSALFTAISSGSIEGVEIVLDMGASPNSVDSSKFCRLPYAIKDQPRSALFCASFMSSEDIIKLLIDRQANIYAPLNDRETLIHYVFEHAAYENINVYLECAEKLNFNAVDQLGRTVLLAAGSWNNALPGYMRRYRFLEVLGPVIRVLDSGADLTAVDNEGQHTLHHLLNNRKIEQHTILQFLSRPACQILALQKDAKGFSPLHYALRTLRPVVCEVLMALGGDLLDPDPNGTTALHYIASQALREYEPQKSRGDVGQEYSEGYFQGCLHLWEKYLAMGGDINVRDTYGSPPLFTYLSSPKSDNMSSELEEKEKLCHVNNFETFFGRGRADRHARNTAGETALHVVAKRAKRGSRKDEHEKKLFECLMGMGLDPLAEDDGGRSALDIAAACGKEEILDLFRYSA